MYKLFFFTAETLDPTQSAIEQRRSVAQQVAPGLCGYSESEPLTQQLGDDNAFCARVVELYWMRSSDALNAFEARQRLAEAILEAADTPALMGLERVVLRTAEHRPERDIKLLFPFRRKAELSLDAFQRYWWQQHGPIAARTEGATGYLQYHRLAETYDHASGPWDAVTELHFPDWTATQAAMASRQMTEDQAGDANHFVEPESVQIVALKPHWLPLESWR